MDAMSTPIASTKGEQFFFQRLEMRSSCRCFLRFKSNGNNSELPLMIEKKISLLPD
jgi:hypothetical protein